MFNQNSIPYQWFFAVFLATPQQRGDFRKSLRLVTK